MASGLTDGSRRQPSAKKVLILGGGFGGTYVLRTLVPALKPDDNVETTIVNDENFFLFLPLLHEVATGAIEPRHIAYPIRRFRFRNHFKFVQAVIEKIDLAGRKVSTSAGTLDFDYLILSLGSIPDMPGLYSARQSLFTLKSLEDARRLKNHIIDVFERASVTSDPEQQKRLLTFVVSGGGYIGVQLVSALRDFILIDLARLYNTIDRNLIKIVLVEAESKIIPRLHTNLGAYIMKQIKRMGIDVRLKSRVTHVFDDHIEINHSETMPASTVIWVPGVVTNPLVATVDAQKDSAGRIFVNEYLEVPGFPGAYAVGDCAHFIDPKSGQPIISNAHTGVRQAKVAARNILADIRRKQKRPYIYSSPFEVISVGSSKAVFSFNNLRLYGFGARLLWMGGYSLLVTKTYNQIRVVTDWLLSLVFGRDTIFLR